MTPQSLGTFLTAAWRIAGWRAPALLLRYARLTFHNRTSARRSIMQPAMMRGAQPVAATVRGGDLVIPVYNNFDDTNALLGSLRTNPPDGSSIIVVNDGSTDARIAALLAAFCRDVASAKLIENEHNLGFVQTCNRGIAASRRDIVILNTDIVLPPGAIARMFASLQSAPGIASVTPFSNNAYGVSVPLLAYINAVPFGATTPEFDLCFQRLAPTAAIELPSGIGFCMGLSRAVIDKLGAFDERFGLGYGEETDFCQRAKAHGYKSMLVANTYVFHRGGVSFGGTWQDKSRKATLEILSRYPRYVPAVGRHLRSGPARSIGFAAMLALAELKTGEPLQVVDDDEAPLNGPAAGELSPAPSLRICENRNGCEATLTGRGESYAFNFINRACLDRSLALRKH